MSRRLSRFAAAGGLALAALASHLAGAATPKLTTLFSFDGANGQYPDAALIADASGNLLGTTQAGGGYSTCIGGCGTVFELAKTKNGYASTPTILASFNFTDGAYPSAGLIIDADGNLFGTTAGGGAYSTCIGGCGTVFELAKTKSGYADAPTILVDFNGPDGANPTAGLIFDADGNLFGTASAGGASGYGTVFEIAKTRQGYADTPTTLVSFDGSNGVDPTSSLIFNKKGDLLGTTFNGGPYGVGTVFKIAKIRGGHASSPTTLVSFNVSNGALPYSALIADARGNLFGTTAGGTTYQGTVFELAKTRSGYATTPTILASFSPLTEPVGLLADAKGELLGPTYFGGANNDACSGGCGTVYELTGSGFVPRLAFAGTPGSTDCYGESVLSLMHKDRNLDVAAAALGLGRAEAVQTAVSEYCGTSAP